MSVALYSWQATSLYEQARQYYMTKSAKRPAAEHEFACGPRDMPLGELERRRRQIQVQGDAQRADRFVCLSRQRTRAQDAHHVIESDHVARNNPRTGRVAILSGAVPALRGGSGGRAGLT